MSLFAHYFVVGQYTVGGGMRFCLACTQEKQLLVMSLPLPLVFQAALHTLHTAILDFAPRRPFDTCYKMESQKHNLDCGICYELFKNPCTIQCGHSFCQDCITSHWDSQQGRGQIFDCPFCKKEFDSRPALSRNINLYKLASGLGQSEKEARTTGAEGAREEELCERHGKSLVLFCNQDRMSVCCECAVKECVSHKKSMLEEERQSQEQILQRKEKEMERIISETEKNIHDLSENIAQVKVTLQQTSTWVSAKFGSLLKVLVEKQEAMELFLEEQRRDTITEAEQRLQEMEERVQKLRENKKQVCKMQKLTDTELIKESMLVKVPEFQAVPTEVSSSLQERLSGVTEVLSRVSKLLHEDLERALGAALGLDKQASPQDKRPILAVVPSPAAPFAPGLREGLDGHRCSLTFDPRTANGHLSLSCGNTRAEHLSSGPPAPPADQARFDHTWQVLCLQGFSRGVHYWELEVSKPWAYIGVTYESIPRKEKGKRCMVGMNELSWSLQLDERQLSAWHGGRQEPVSASPLPAAQPSRVGVQLDYEAGTLSFYGPDGGRLHAFHCAFTHTLYPACWIGEGVSVTLSAGGEDCCVGTLTGNV
uniref:Tripartite motif containing 65 n=1 Tax=Neogobius melanostomus TaxID=47308 RepID=A0A8C6SJJ4_9GOBI